MNTSLYKQDFSEWIQETVKHLKQRSWQDVDLDNLVAELEALGGAQKAALESNLVVLLMHLLKYKYQPEYRSNSWLSSIVEHRRRILKALKHSPSLKPYLTDCWQECYLEAREDAATETGLSLATFPTKSPWTEIEVLQVSFLPK